MVTEEGKLEGARGEDYDASLNSRLASKHYLQVHIKALREQMGEEDISAIISVLKAQGFCGRLVAKMVGLDCRLIHLFDVVSERRCGGAIYNDGTWSQCPNPAPNRVQLWGQKYAVLCDVCIIPRFGAGYDGE